MKKMIKLALALMMMFATLLGASARLFALEEPTALEEVEISNVEETKDDLQLEEPVEVEAPEEKVTETLNLLVGTPDTTVAAPQLGIVAASVETDLEDAKLVAIDANNAKANATKDLIDGLTTISSDAKVIVFELIDLYLFDSNLNVEIATTSAMVTEEVANFEATMENLVLAVETKVGSFNALGSLNAEVIELTSIIIADSNLTLAQQMAVVNYVDQQSILAMVDMEATGFDETKVTKIVDAYIAEMNRVVTLFTENNGDYAKKLAVVQESAYTTIDDSAKKLTDTINANAYVSQETKASAIELIELEVFIAKMNVDYAISIAEVDEALTDLRVWFEELETASFADEMNGKLYDKANGAFLNLQANPEITDAQIDQAKTAFNDLLRTYGDAIANATSMSEISDLYAKAEVQIQKIYDSFLPVTPTPVAPTPVTPTPVANPTTGNTTTQTTLPNTGLADSQLMISISLLTIGFGLVIVSRKK